MPVVPEHERRYIQRKLTCLYNRMTKVERDLSLAESSYQTTSALNDVIQLKRSVDSLINQLYHNHKYETMWLVNQLVKCSALWRVVRNNIHDRDRARLVKIF